MAKINFEVVEFDVTTGAEGRLQQLRDRDVEIGRLALGLGMRQRISELEDENAHLLVQSRKLIEWRQSNTFRISRAITKSLAVFKRKR